MIKDLLKYLFLGPIAFLYDIITETRNKLYDWQILQAIEFSFPIISVGNITIGGTGKTPHIEYLIRLLLKKNLKIAVLSRGYMRKSKGFQDSEKFASPAILGDELYQMYLKFPEVNFFADADRVHGVRKILHKNNCDVILLDDAFQHRRIKPGLSIILNDFRRPIYSDHLLPLGRLREHPHQKQRAKIIITSKCPNALTPIEQRIVLTKINPFPFQDLYFSTLNYKSVKPVFEGSKTYKSLKECTQEYKNILLLTGISQPKVLENELAKHCKNYTSIHYPDHHFFTANDINKIESVFSKIDSPKIILTTEKDASRLKEHSNSNIKSKKMYFYIEIEIDFLKEKKEFNNQIVKYVAENRRKY